MELEGSLDALLEFLQKENVKEHIQNVTDNLNMNLDILLAIDETICLLAKDAAEIPGTRPYNAIKKGDLILCGSCAEGCMLARWFNGKPKHMLTPKSDNNIATSNMSNSACEEGSGSRNLDIGKLVESFLAGTDKSKAERNHERIQGLHDVSGLLLQLLANPPQTDIPISFSSQTVLAQHLSGQQEQSESTIASNQNLKLESVYDPWETELDVMMKFGSLMQDSQDLIEPVVGKSGYVKIPFHPKIKQYVDKRVWQKIEQEGQRVGDVATYAIQTNGYFDPWKIKKLIGIIAAYHDDTNTIPTILAWIFKVSPSDVHISWESTPTKTSHEMTMKIQLKNKFSLNFAGDLVAGLHVAFWPTIAAKWINRKQRKWPNEEKIADMVDAGCYLVPRPSDGGVDTYEFMWSFGITERALIQLMSRTQRKAYFVFKMLFYRYVKPLNKDKLCSYMCKTTMLWFTERFPPSHSVWSEDVIFSCVSFLLWQLKGFLHKNNLPHFFIPEMNLLKDVPHETCMAVVQKLESVLLNLPQHIPFDIPQVATSSKAQTAALRYLIDIAKAVENSMIGAFLRVSMGATSGFAGPEAYSYDEFWDDEVRKYLA